MKQKVVRLLILAFFFLGIAGAETVSFVRFDEAVTAEELSDMAGSPVVLESDEAGTAHASLPDDAVRKLKDSGIHFEVLWTETTLSGGGESKALESITRQSSSGFSINPTTYQTLNVSGAPAGATVTSVTLRVKGMAAYADLCSFQLIDAANRRYTLPTWYDEIWFDHTVSGISTFYGRPVNQAWTLEAHGSNTSGERVDQWWITIYYQSVPPPTEGEGEDVIQTEGEIDPGTFCNYPPDAIPVELVNCDEASSDMRFEQLVIDGQRYVEVEVPSEYTTYDYCSVLNLVGCPYVLIQESTKRIELRFTPPVQIMCLLVVTEPICSGRAIIGPLVPGQWHFLSVHDGTNPGRPNFDVSYTVDPVPVGTEGEAPQPGVTIIGRPNAEVGSSTTLRAFVTSIEGAVSYQWYKNGIPIAGATGEEYLLSNLTYEDSAVYRVVVLAGADTYQSQAFPLSVLAEGSLPAHSLSLILALILLVGAGSAFKIHRDIFR